MGLVTAACFTEMGNTVTGVDTNEARLTDLRAGRMPIYERKRRHRTFCGNARIVYSKILNIRFIETRLLCS